MKSKVQDIAKRFSLGQYSDICKTMVKTEKDLQEYLTSLSKLVGFEVSESVSLYELPSLLAKDTNDNNWPPVMNQLFLYTLCERDDNIPDDEFSYYMSSGLTLDKFDLGGSCIEEWNRFFGGKLKHYIQNLLFACIIIRYIILFQALSIHVKMLKAITHAAISGQMCLETI